MPGPGSMSPRTTKKGPGRYHVEGDSVRSDKIAIGGFPGDKLRRKAAAKVLTIRGGSTKPDTKE